MRCAPKLLAALAAALALAGCVHPDFAGMKDYWMLHTEDIQKLKPGMTQAEVQDILGKAPWKLYFPQRDETIWSYRYLEYQTRMVATLTFDARGVLKTRTLEFDFSSYSRP